MEKTRILIADDHWVVVDGLEDALGEVPEFEVVGVALDGLEAVSLAESLRPDIVIMDIAMPKLSGIEATRDIVSRCPDTRIIIFTMYADKEYIIDLFKIGVSGYVLKKDPTSELVLAVKAVAKGATFFSSCAPSILVQHMEDLEKRPPETEPYETLSLREREIFSLLARGLSQKEIGYQLCISPKTVGTHKAHIMQKLGAESISDLFKIAVNKGVLEV